MCTVFEIPVLFITKIGKTICKIWWFGIVKSIGGATTKLLGTRQAVSISCGKKYGHTPRCTERDAESRGGIEGERNGEMVAPSKAN